LNIYREPNIKVVPEAKLELLGDVDHEPDELYIEFKKEFFEITGATASSEDLDVMKFALPTTFLAKFSAKKPNKMANSKAERRIGNIVFVNVIANINTSKKMGYQRWIRKCKKIIYLRS